LTIKYKNIECKLVKKSQLSLPLSVIKIIEACDKGG